MKWEIKEKNKERLRLNKNKLINFLEIINGIDFIIPDIGFTGECEDSPINFLFNFYLKNIIYYKNFQLLTIYDNIDDNYYNTNFKNRVLTDGNKYNDLAKKLNLIKIQNLDTESFWF